MKRAQRLLLIAFALSLLVHAIVAIVLHPQRADFQSQAEVVSIVRRSTIAVAHTTPPPARPHHTPAPRNQTAPKPRGRTGAPARSEGGGPSRATPAPPPASTAAPATPSGACTAPNAPAAVAASPPPPDIPLSVRADATDGTASVTVALDAQGQILGTTVAQGTGNPSLDIVAVAMARAATYSAALHDCKPIAGSATFSVKFVAW